MGKHEIKLEKQEYNPVTKIFIIEDGEKLKFNETLLSVYYKGGSVKEEEKVLVNNGETEVTQELWEAVMGSNPRKFSGSQRPVERVSWNDCQEFITKLNNLTGKNFRLPTEAEWEYAARGGNKSKSYKYSGSNTIDNVAWYGSNSSSRTHDVKTKQANELGIYDMSGNVYEWCQDRYDRKYYQNSSQTNPTGPMSGSLRVLRGGSWSYYAGNCRVSRRYHFNPGFRSNSRGLRLAL